MVNPWLTIIGIGEDGLAGLSEASRKALAYAETVFGGDRHLALAEVGARGRPWPVPFDATPCSPAAAVRRSFSPPAIHSGTASAALLRKCWAPANGSPIPRRRPSRWWHRGWDGGWRTSPAWPACGPVREPGAASRARRPPDLPDARRQGRDSSRRMVDRARLGCLAFGPSRRSAARAKRSRTHRADNYAADLGAALVAVALEARSNGLPRSSGLADDLFVHDGQITKRPIRALALSALAPRRGERLWDIGAGSGSISVEWALRGGTADAIEARDDRASNIRENAAAFGVSHRSPSLKEPRRLRCLACRRRTRSFSAADSIPRCSRLSGRFSLKARGWWPMR